MTRDESLARAVAEARAEPVRALPDPGLLGGLRKVADATPTVDASLKLSRTSVQVVADLVDAARAELAHLWHDYATETRHALNGEFSVGTENRAYRIARLTMIVGPCRWEDAPPEALRDGSYRLLHAVLDVDPRIDEQALTEFLARDRG